MTHIPGTGDGGARQVVRLGRGGGQVMYPDGMGKEEEQGRHGVLHWTDMQAGGELQ